MIEKEVLNSIDYMEQNIKNDIKIEDVANHIGYSSFHYIRLFQFATKDTPWNYLRKRRLSEAAKELKRTGEKIIKVAMDYQFSSSEAFSRAFSDYFNISPSRCRKSSDHIKLFYKPKLTNITIKKRKDVFMEPIIKTLRSKKLIGMIYYGKNEEDEIATMWGRHIEKIEQLDHLVNKDVTYGFCFHTEDYKDAGNFHYLISKEVEDLTNIPMDLVGKTIPEREYAIFTHDDDPSLLGDTYQFIFGEWLQKQDFEVDEYFNMERYSPEGIEILIPLKK
ncbi:AraC family transcriptional regulator [Haloplasma contractile]|uniref:Transcriptional regulator AraC family protein n=1 Tax=Haloplasma contractile SSD-17B TaxID=1033810 RepID=F7Q114_9MOLU|nr:AraC family transcriptional regulator [Haloplasma contractile]ERJ11343.1 Transcriptional regulator AraC family protein [Haloplasma contractile SSD-17B]